MARTFALSAASAAAIILATSWVAPAAAAPAASGVAKSAGSLSGGDAAPTDCAARRKLYLDSQACFERYRLANGAVRQSAFKKCRNVVDPSPQCGPDLPTK